MARPETTDATGDGDASLSMTVTVTSVDGRTALRVRGEVDMATAAQFREFLDAATASDDGDLVLDLSGVALMDSSGVAQLIGAARNLSEGRTLVLHDPTDTVGRLIDVTGIASLKVIALEPDDHAAQGDA